MKRKILAVAVALVAGSAMAWTAPRRSAAGAFRFGDRLLTPEIAVFSHTAGFGANYEYGYRGQVGIGGDLLFVLEGSGGVVIAPDVAYHFRTRNRDLDLYVGAGPSLAVGFGGGSDFWGKLFFGSRLFFERKLAACFKVFALLGGDSSLGAAFGVTFRLD